jgi:hypothetical protein
VKADRLLATVGLRHRGDADGRTLLDVGKLRLGHGSDTGVVGERHVDRATVARLDHKPVAIDPLDSAANADRRRLLRALDLPAFLGVR